MGMPVAAYVDSTLTSFMKIKLLVGSPGMMPADEGVAPAEHEREAPSPVQKPADAGVEHAFDQHVDGFAISTEAGLEHGEARLHAEHEERAEQNPAGVDRVDDVAGRRGLVRIGGRRGRGGAAAPRATPARPAEREPPCAPIPTPSGSASYRW